MKITAQLLHEHLALATARLRSAEHGIAMVQALLVHIPTNEVIEPDQLELFEQLPELEHFAGAAADTVERLHMHFNARQVAIARKGE